MITWNQVQTKLEEVTKEIHQVADKHNETRPKVLCVALEAALRAPIEGKFIFPADVWKNFQTGIKSAFQKNSHPEVQAKIALLEFWLRFYVHRIQNPKDIIDETFTVMETLLAVYKVKRNAIRTSLIDVFFAEANRQLAWRLDLLKTSGVEEVFDPSELMDEMEIVSETTLEEEAVAIKEAEEI